MNSASPARMKTDSGQRTAVLVDEYPRLESDLSVEKHKRRLVQQKAAETRRGACQRPRPFPALPSLAARV
jgi:hypothetical protein